LEPGGTNSALFTYLGLKGYNRTCQTVYHPHGVLAEMNIKMENSKMIIVWNITNYDVSSVW